MAKQESFFISYKKNLYGFFEFLSTDHATKGLFNGEIGKLYHNMQALQATNKVSAVEVELPCFEINLRKSVDCGVSSDSYLSIGGVIRFGTKGVLEQSISVCISLEPHEIVRKSFSFGTAEMEANKRHIIRRFHFDIDCSQDKTDRPISHIQYGGNVHDSQRGGAEYNLISTIDLPRIPSFPLDVIQVTNFFIMQFDTSLGGAFSKPRWRGLVVENDRIWKDYYIHKMISGTGRRKTFYEWACEPFLFD